MKNSTYLASLNLETCSLPKAYFLFYYKNMKTFLTNFLPPRIYSALSSEHVIQDVLKYQTFCILSWKHEWCNLFCLKRIYVLIDFYIRQESVEIYHKQINMILLMNCFLCVVYVRFSLTNLVRTGVGRSDSLEGKLEVLCFSIICFKIFQVNFEIKILESNGFFSF